MDNSIGVDVGKLVAPARFDWYQGSAWTDEATLRGILSEVSPGCEWEDLERVPHGYAYGWRMSDADGRVADVWAGGAQHFHPHFVSSGSCAHDVAELLRAELPGKHTVSRADPCMDFEGQGAYDAIQDAFVQVAQEQSIKLDTRGDHLLHKVGRTVYLGSTTSHVRARVYDKSAELRHKFQAFPEVLATVPDHLARIEGQIRPKGASAKIAAASASPVELFGSALWLRILMGHVAGLDLVPFQASPVWRKSDDDRAYAAMLTQYGNLFYRLLEDLGSPDCVGRQLFDDLADRSRLKKQGRSPSAGKGL